MNLPDMKSDSVTSSTTSDSKPLVKVLIAVLGMFERHGWHHPSITTFIHTLRWNHEYATNYVPVSNWQPAAAGRNAVCKHFFESEADWLCMIDNDMSLPLNILDTLKDVPEDAGVVVPRFYLWDQDKAAITLCWGMDRENVQVVGEREIWRMKPGFSKLIKCGTGVVFIHRKALEKIPYPWFKYVYDESGKMTSTEDIQFCKAAMEAGVTIYGNSNIAVGHYHQVDLLVLADNFIHKDVKPLDVPEPEGVSST